MGLLSYCFGWRKLDIRPGELVLEVGSGHKPMIRSDVLCDKFLADATERCGDIWWWPVLASRRTGHMGPCGWANGVPSSGLTHPRTWPLGLRERSPERGTASLFAGAPRRSRLRRWLPGCTTNIWRSAAGGCRGRDRRCEREGDSVGKSPTVGATPRRIKRQRNHRPDLGRQALLCSRPRGALFASLASLR